MTEDLASQGNALPGSKAKRTSKIRFTAAILSRKRKLAKHKKAIKIIADLGRFSRFR
ncbi:hypothetical protein [Lactobacillus delbrueckii]|uniref:hypothetical protein n=1 Tax=Lactobacillus delbrueckii TaxID=1584 RepID=UPI0013EE4753|nr:hypothetical protein [Lactobacillus delbrueckii]MCD5431349.1 hypothetical protein [Lactobacillus delbrueckii subsp. lactis]MCD5433169.1 hypothetical protein [Lactobacillus delbrueckii subsp. lactis]MCD5436573.1 hypothetical protein [Lactobacillus delbrueckii subsp. lactis]MCD5472930.1 hypothetical protein [Lactobacillus delbrueckii subsp. lactis]MCD5492465.1 hypothetical protein [Lactobacillus delbrueckii subsp. lactis]